MSKLPWAAVRVNAEEGWKRVELYRGLVGWGNFMQKGIFLSTEEEEEGAAPLNIHTGYRQKGTFVLGGSSLF